MREIVASSASVGFFARAEFGSDGRLVSLSDNKDNASAAEWRTGETQAAARG